MSHRENISISKPTNGKKSVSNININPQEIKKIIKPDERKKSIKPEERKKSILKNESERSKTPLRPSQAVIKPVTPIRAENGKSDRPRTPMIEPRKSNKLNNSVVPDKEKKAEPKKIEPKKVEPKKVMGGGGIANSKVSNDKKVGLSNAPNESSSDLSKKPLQGNSQSQSNIQSEFTELAKEKIVKEEEPVADAKGKIKTEVKEETQTKVEIKEEVNMNADVDPISKSENINENKNELNLNTGLTNIINNVTITNDEIKNTINIPNSTEKNTNTQPNPKALPLEIQNSTPSIKALFIAINNEVLPDNLKFLLVTGIPKLKLSFNLENFLQIQISKIKKRLEIIEVNYGGYYKDSQTSHLIEKVFKPSKTAINGLGFINKDEEIHLSTKEQPEEILNVFRMIYLFIDENPDKISRNKLIENLIDVIVPKLGMDSLKNLLSQYVTECCGRDFDDARYTLLCDIVKNNPKILSSPEYIKLNRCVSYMIFIIKETWDYLSLKTLDGVYVYNLRKIDNERKRLNQRLEKLNNMLINHTSIN